METLKMSVKRGNRTVEVNVPLPVPGSVGTMFCGSDRYIVCCNTVLSNKKCGLVILYDVNKEKDIIKGDDGYEYLNSVAYNRILGNPQNHSKQKYYSLRKNGTWYEVGEPIQPGCGGVRFGEGDEYRDPEF